MNEQITLGAELNNLCILILAKVSISLYHNKSEGLSASHI